MDIAYLRIHQKFCVLFGAINFIGHKVTLAPKGQFFSVITEQGQQPMGA
jgi:hypothetical protein